MTRTETYISLKITAVEYCLITLYKNYLHNDCGIKVLNHLMTIQYNEFPAF
jgi:hypothetical protein